MSLNTFKKRVSAKSTQEKAKQEQRASDLLACEREFSLLQQKAIDDLKQQHSHVTGKLRAQNESLQSQVQNFDEEIKNMQMFIHVREKEHEDAIKKLDFQMDILMESKSRELSAMKKSYEQKIEEITRHLKAVELELFQVKNFVKPHADVYTQTAFDSSKTVAAERIIPLKTHLEMIRSLRQSFMREKFQLHEEFQDRLEASKRQNSALKGESDLISNDKQTLTNQTPKCQGSKLIAELEKQRNISEATKLRDLINPEHKNIHQQKITICKLQTAKKEQEIYIESLKKQIEEVKYQATVATSEKLHSSVLPEWNLDEILKIKEMAQDILDQRSQAERYFFDVLKRTKQNGEDNLSHEINGKNGINGLNGVTCKQKEEILNTLFSDMLKSSDQYKRLEEVLANKSSPLLL